jgi:hypothetical protein
MFLHTPHINSSQPFASVKTDSDASTCIFFSATKRILATFPSSASEARARSKYQQGLVSTSEHDQQESHSQVTSVHNGLGVHLVPQPLLQLCLATWTLSPYFSLPFFLSWTPLLESTTAPKHPSNFISPLETAASWHNCLLYSVIFKMWRWQGPKECHPIKPFKAE